MKHALVHRMYRVSASASFKTLALTYRKATALTVTAAKPFPLYPDTHEFQTFGIPRNSTASLPNSRHGQLPRSGSVVKINPAEYFSGDSNSLEFEEPIVTFDRGKEIIGRAMNQFAE